MKHLPWVLVVLGLSLAACAERGVDGPTAGSAPALPALPGHVEATLFPAERVLAEAASIGLSDAQKTAIAADVRTTQGAWDELAARLRTEQGALVRVLDRPRVDPDAAQRAAAAVMRTEDALKSTHLALLVRIKNRLTERQQRALREPVGPATR